MYDVKFSESINASIIEKNRWMKKKNTWITGEKKKRKVGTSLSKIRILHACFQPSLL